MTQQYSRLFAELSPQEEAEIVAMEANIRNIHQLAFVGPGNAKSAAKAINSIRQEAKRGLEALRTVDIGALDAGRQREHLVHVETFTRIISATNKVPPSRLM